MTSCPRQFPPSSGSATGLTFPFACRLLQHRPFDGAAGQDRLCHFDRQFLEGSNPPEHREAPLRGSSDLSRDNAGDRRLPGAGHDRCQFHGGKLQRRDDRSVCGRRHRRGVRHVHGSAHRHLLAADGCGFPEAADDTDPAELGAVLAPGGLFCRANHADHAGFGERAQQSLVPPEPDRRPRVYAPCPADAGSSARRCATVPDRASRRTRRKLRAGVRTKRGSADCGEGPGTPEASSLAAGSEGNQRLLWRLFGQGQRDRYGDPLDAADHAGILDPRPGAGIRCHPEAGRRRVRSIPRRTSRKTRPR